MRFRPGTAVLATVLGIAGCAGTPSVATPACEHPAPLLGQYDGRAPGYQVRLRTPGGAAAREVVARHSLHPRDVSSNGEWIALAGANAKTVAALRCDAAVESVQFDTYLGWLSH
jgi:hypothetical protein